jgi:cbb3-type cytochrome oxidase subunit 1
LLEDFLVVGDRLSEGGNLVLMFTDLVDKSVDGFIAGSLVGSVFLIGGCLVVAYFSEDFINKEGEFFEGRFDSHVKGDCRENC